MAAAMFAAVSLWAQTSSPAPADLRFEVASLKPSQPGGRGGAIRPAEGGMRYVANNYSIRGMITVAYRIKPDQVAGAPAWFDSDLYDMDAKAEKPSTPDELHTMLMNLLVDRMHLKFHREQREMRRYTLLVDKDGPRLTPHEAQNAHDPWIDIATLKFLHLQLTATAVPMDYVAYRLAPFLDRPVVDLTGLKGGYDFKLSFTADLPAGFPEHGLVNGEEPDTTGSNLYQALKQQLGLELKPDKGPVEVIVIDRLDKPRVD